MPDVQSDITFILAPPSGQGEKPYLELYFQYSDRHFLNVTATRQDCYYLNEILLLCHPSRFSTHLGTHPMHLYHSVGLHSDYCNQTFRLQQPADHQDRLSSGYLRQLKFKTFGNATTQRAIRLPSSFRYILKEYDHQVRDERNNYFTDVSPRYTHISRMQTINFQKPQRCTSRTLPSFQMLTTVILIPIIFHLQ